MATLIGDLQPAMKSFASVVNDSFDLFEQTNLTSRCFSNVILPTGDTVIQDGTNTTGASVFQEFWYTMVAFASDAQGFDGNGSYTRTATGGGDRLVRTGKLSGRPKNRDILYGHALNPPLGTRPKRPIQQAALQDERDCYKNAKPNLNGPAAAAGPPDTAGQVRLAIQKHLRDFIAVIVMIILALLVGGYILSNQRFYLPAWVPVLGTDFFELKGEFVDRAVRHSGPGSDRNIAGVPVGEIKKVELVDGRAIVTLLVRQKYADMVKQDATMLLRPKTGLKDMVIELDPGTQTLPAVEDGFMVPVEQTQPDVNLDEILSNLDRDTRDYLRLLVAGGGEGLKNNGRNFANTFRRFEPLNRDVAKLTGELRKRRKNLGAADPQPPAAGLRGRHQGQGAGGADRVAERGVRGVRQPGRKPARVPARAADRTADHEQGADPVRGDDRSARARAAEAAAGSPCARAGPARAAPVRPPDHPADQEPAPAVRARGAADGRGAAAGDAGPREGDAQAGDELRGPEQAVQRAHLQPVGRDPGGLPVLGLLAEPHRRVGLLDAGRARPDPARHHLHRLRRAGCARGDPRRSTTSSAR